MFPQYYNTILFKYFILHVQRDIINIFESGIYIYVCELTAIKRFPSDKRFLTP